MHVNKDSFKNETVPAIKAETITHKIMISTEKGVLIQPKKYQGLTLTKFKSEGRHCGSLPQHGNLLTSILKSK